MPVRVQHCRRHSVTWINPEYRGYRPTFTLTPPESEAYPTWTVSVALLEEHMSLGWKKVRLEY